MGNKESVSHSSSSFEARRRGSHLRMTLLPLPPQLPHQCARRMAEQLLHRRGIELVDALKILGVYAAGYEQAIDPEAVRTDLAGTRLSSIAWPWRSAASAMAR